jgi:hypothetical protein
VIDERRAVGVLDDDVGVREALRDVAGAQMPASEQVAAVVNPRGAGLEGGQGIVHARKLFVVDLDQLGGARGDLRRLGGDGCHRLTLEAHTAVRQHGLRGEDGAGGGLSHAAGQFHAELVARHVPRGEYRDHARQRARGFRVEADDARRGVGAADDPAVEHAGQRQVARVDGPAAHLFPRVRPRLASADHAIGHAALAPDDLRSRTEGATTSRECR